MKNRKQHIFENGNSEKDDLEKRTVLKIEQLKHDNPEQEIIETGQFGKGPIRK